MAKKAFNLGDYLRDAQPMSESDTEQITRVPLESIDPDPNNFYSLEGLGELAANIETVGLLDPLRVRPSGERYVIVSGHRRRAALQLLRDSGCERWRDGVPCIIELGEASDAMRELRLIFANSSTRVMSPADLSKQAERVTQLLYELKEQGMEFPGSMRAHVAEACKVSQSKLARLHAIRTNLQPDLLAMFDGGKLSEAAAYELQKLPVAAQAYLGAQQKVRSHGIGMSAAEHMVRDAELYMRPRCTCPDGSECEQTLARFKQTATSDMVWRYCGGGCCLKCPRSLSDCPYRCARSKKQIEERKAEEKTEQERAAQQEEARKDLQRERMAGEYARILELAEAAGLEDDAELSLSDADCVRELRERARGEGFYPWRLHPGNTPFSGIDADDLIAAAETLGVSVERLVGREETQAPRKMSDSDTEAAWRQGTPPRDGRYLCMVDIGTSRLHEQKCEYREGEWSCYGRPFSEIGTVEYWWPLPPEKLVRTKMGDWEEETEEA